jgi:hypothetical protein
MEEQNAEAANYIIYTKNHTATHVLTNTTPFEIHYAKKLDISKQFLCVVELTFTTIHLLDEAFFSSFRRYSFFWIYRYA